MFQLQARDVRQINNYEHALQHYNTLPRNRHDAVVRHLSRNRSLTLEWRGGGEDRCLAACYNNHPVVRYYPDGHIELDHCGWETPSTRMFMYRVSPFYINSHRGSLYVTANYTSKDVEVYRGFFLVGRNTKLVLGDDNAPVILNPIQEYRTVLDKARAAEVRDGLKPFVQQVKLLASAITPSVALQEQYREQVPQAVPEYRANIGERILRGEQAAYDVGVLFVLNDAMCSFGWALRNGVEPEVWMKAVSGTITKMYSALYRRLGCTQEEAVPLGTYKLKDTI